VTALTGHLVSRIRLNTSMGHAQSNFVDRSSDVHEARNSTGTAFSILKMMKALDKMAGPSPVAVDSHTRVGPASQQPIGSALCAANLLMSVNATSVVVSRTPLHQTIVQNILEFGRAS